MRNKFLTKILGATLGLAMAIGVGVGVAANNNAAREVNAAGAAGDVYNKITSMQDLTSGGQYLIVSSVTNKAFNGALATGSIDANNNYVSVTINNNSITTTAANKDSYFTISQIAGKTTYAIKASGGFYIGSDAADSNASNELDRSNDPIENTISYSTDHFNIKGPDHYLVFNAGTNALRFRYFKSTTSNNGAGNGNDTGYHSITLYKKAESQGGEPTLSSISINTAPTKTTYNAGEFFDPTGLIITRTYTDESSNTYSYADHSSDFSFTPNLTTRLTATNNAVTIAYEGCFVNQSITVNSVAEPAVEEKTIAQFNAVENNAYRAYLVTATIKSFYNEATKNARGDLTLTDGVNDLRVYRSSITSSALSWNGGNASYSYESPDDFISNQTTNNLEVGTSITMKLIRADYNSNIQANGVITWIQPIEASEISLDKSSAAIDINEEIELVPSFVPANATSAVTWESSNESIATVTGGVVTGVATGTAVVTAKVSDSVKAQCEITVSDYYQAVLKYTGDSNKGANEYTAVALTEALNLNKDILSVSYNKNGASNDMALRTDGIRMYATKKSSNGNKFTVSIIDGYKIKEIYVDFDDGYSARAVISSTKSDNITGSEGNYVINDSQFTVFDDNSSANDNTQVRFQSITIRYKTAAKVDVSNLVTKTSLSYRYSKEADAFTYSKVALRFGGSISTSLWTTLNAESTIVGYGVLLATDDLLGFSLQEWYEDARAADGVTNVDQAISKLCGNGTGDYNMAANYYKTVASKTPVVVNGNYGWNLYIGMENPSDSDLTTEFTAVAYIRTSSDELVFFAQQTKSAAKLAKDLLDADADYDDNNGLEGSLEHLAGLLA